MQIIYRFWNYAFFLILAPFCSFSQPILFVSQPSSIAGFYNYGPGDAAQGWGYSYDSIQVQAPLVRGTSSNAGGDSLACDTTLINALAVAGKICVLYRGSCEFGVKALAAQRAGAIGCIIINHSAGVLNIGAGGVGGLVTIPVMLVSNSDGALIRQRMDSGDSVIVFMGDKTGYFLNDIGIGNGSVIRPTEFSIPANQALNAGEYLFRLGAAVKNYGQNAQTNLGLNVKIDFTNPAGVTNTVYNQNATLATLASDSTDTLRTPNFDPSAFGAGRYNIAYTIIMPAGITDQFPADNVVNQGFVINSNIISKVRLDSLGNMLYSGGIRPSDAIAGPYDFGIWYYANKGSRLKVDSIRFSFVTNPGSNLVNESVLGKVSQWLDLNQDGLVDAGEIVDLADGIYTYTDTSGSNSQRSVLVTDIINNTPGVILADSSIYLFSAYYAGSQTTVFTNVDTRMDYTMSSRIYQQNVSAVQSGNWNPNGFGPKSIPAISVVTSNINPLYPNILPSGTINICNGSSILLQSNFNAGHSFQWKLNGNNISGATNSSYSATTPGTYSVFVTNSSGATGLSPGVVVTVSPLLPAPVISSVGSTNLCMGGRVRLNATLVNGVSYQWTRNGVDIPGMILGTLEAIQSGNYAVKVTRGICQSVSNTIQVTVSPTCQGISLGMVQTCQNDTIEVPIYQNGLQAISAMNLRFSYNPNHLVYLGYTAPVSPLSTMGVNQVMVNSQQAWVNLNWVDLTPQNLAAGDILKIRFRAISNADLEWDTLISPAEVWDVNLNPLPLVYTSTSVVVYNSPSLQFIQRTICEGQSVNIAGQTFNTSGTFTLGTVPSTSFSTCDSNFQLQLLVIPRINDLGSVSICQGQTYTFRGRVLNTTGIYYDTLINSLGCDSLIKLNLTVNPTYDQIQRRVICQGSCFYFGGQNRCSSGTFNYTYLSLNGCDSIVTLHLTVSDSLVLQSNSGSNGICPGGQISLGSQQSWPTGGIPIWFQNGIQLSGINDSILNVQAAGAYQLRIYIPSGNCSLYSNVFSVVQLNCNKVSGNLRYDNSLNTALAGVPIHLKTLLGNIIASDTSDSSGYYELTGYQNGNYVLDASINYLPGGVNSTDALFVQRHFTSLITLSTLRRSAGDVNGSSVTNGTDALLIQRWSTGVISVMPAGTFTTDRPTLNAIGSPLVMNMKALSYGDVNGSYNIPTSAPALVLDTVYGNGNVGTAVVRFTNPGAGVFERGVVWSTSPNPTVSSSKSVAGSGGFGFTHTFPLTNTTTVQYARAYARTNTGVYYSTEKSFTSVLGNRCPGTPSVTDIDGNVYNTVLIGNQCWTQSNLKTSKYRNGDNISTGLIDADWQNTTSGAYAIYNNEPVNDVVYGKLYNHYAVTDSRGLCPTGWHVPTDLEWTTLENHMGGSSISGGEMKSTAVQPTPGGWNLPNTGATNSSGFTALPGGLRDFYGGFLNLSYSGGWWSSSIGLGVEAWYRSLNTNFSFIGRFNGFRTGGFSVRCCRD